MCGGAPRCSGVLASGGAEHDPAVTRWAIRIPPHPRTSAPELLYLYLAAGGVLGTLARYGIGKWIGAQLGTDFPWHTFIINLSGSLLLGFALRASDALAIAPETRGFVTVGFCGAFTTFSTFTWETAVLIQDGQWGRASAYALGSVAAGLACVFAGMWLAGAMFRPRA